MLGSEELDRYFPDRKVGVYITTWNMQGEKVSKCGLVTQQPVILNTVCQVVAKAPVTCRASQTTSTTSSSQRTLNLHKTFTSLGSRRAVLTGAPCVVFTGRDIVSDVNNSVYI